MLKTIVIFLMISGCGKPGDKTENTFDRQDDNDIELNDLSPQEFSLHDLGLSLTPSKDVVCHSIAENPVWRSMSNESSRMNYIYIACIVNDIVPEAIEFSLADGYSFSDELLFREESHAVFKIDLNRQAGIYDLSKFKMLVTYQGIVAKQPVDIKKKDLPK